MCVFLLPFCIKLFGSDYHFDLPKRRRGGSVDFDPFFTRERKHSLDLFIDQFSPKDETILDPFVSIEDTLRKPSVDFNKQKTNSPTAITDIDSVSAKNVKTEVLEKTRICTEAEISSSAQAKDSEEIYSEKSEKKIGIYTPEARRERLQKFKEKRRNRIWEKKIKYDCRKKLADSRPRIKGRFVRREDLEAYRESLEIGDDTSSDGKSSPSHKFEEVKLQANPEREPISVSLPSACRAIAVPSLCTTPTQVQVQPQSQPQPQPQSSTMMAVALPHHNKQATHVAVIAPGQTITLSTGQTVQLCPRDAIPTMVQGQQSQVGVYHLSFSQVPFKTEQDTSKTQNYIKQQNKLSAARVAPY